VLHTILKEPQRAVAKAKQHANSVGLLEAACMIAAILALTLTPNLTPKGSTIWRAEQ
jgi:hypothetical protein